MIDTSLPGNSNEELAYLAGYFDGEGCVTFNRSGKHVPCLRVALQTGDKVTLERFSAAFGGDVKPIKHGTNRQLYVWAVSGDPAQAVLCQLLHWLRAKREVAKLALKCRFLPSGHSGKLSDEERANRCTIAAQVHAINQRVTRAA